MMHIDSIPNLKLTRKYINWKKLSFLNEVIELSEVHLKAIANVLCAMHCFYFDLKVGRELQWCMLTIFLTLN